MKFDQNDYVMRPADLVGGLLVKIEGFDQKANNTIWTLLVKKALKELADTVDRSRFGQVEQIATNKEEQTREFLLDAVWWRRKKEGRNEEMALAVECEWGAKDPHKPGNRTIEEVVSMVEQDFDKLLVVKCPLKLMIFCTDKAGTGDYEGMRVAVVEKMEAYLSQYAHHIEGECYLFVDVAATGERKVWHWIAEASGHQPVRLSEGAPEDRYSHE